MKTPFIFIRDTFCFELLDFTNLLRSNHQDLSKIIKFLDPLVKDGVLLDWLESCEESPMKQDITDIVINAIEHKKSTGYILKRIMLELQLADN